MDDSVIKCPKCGYENDASSEECEKCGVTLMLVLRDKKMPKAPAVPKIPEAPQPAALSNCPKCGHEVSGKAEECIKCGIIFTKYFEIQERKLKESHDNLEIALEDEGPQDETAEKSREEEERREAERLAQEKARQLKKQKEAAAKADADRKKAAQEEPARREVPPAAPSAPVPDGEDRKRIALLEAEAENLRAQNEALIKEKKERERATIVQKAQLDQERQDILKQANEARAKISSLESETAALKNEAAALKKEKEALEAAEAERAAKSRRDAEALQKDREDARRRTRTILETVLPKPTMKELLKKYEGEAIGINVDDPAEIKNAILAKVNEDHFSIMVPENELVHTYPYSHIVSIVEGMDGVALDASEEAPKFPVVIKVFHLMVKKKWGFI